MSIPLLNDFPFCKAWIQGGETLIGLHKSFIHLHERTQVTLSPLYCPRKQATQTTLVEQIKSSSLVEKYHVIHATKKGIILWENIAERADLDGIDLLEDMLFDALILIQSALQRQHHVWWLWNRKGLDTFEPQKEDSGRVSEGESNKRGG